MVGRPITDPLGIIDDPGHDTNPGDNDQGKIMYGVSVQIKSIRIKRY